MNRKGLILICTGLLGAFLAFGTIKPASAETLITVTTTDDVIADDGFCSLREAVIAANTNSINNFAGECAQGSASDTDVIQLQAGLTYELAIAGQYEDSAYKGDLDVLDNATPDVDIMIQAVGQGTAVIDANSIDRVWYIHGAGFSMTGVEITGGSGGLGSGLLNDNGLIILQDTIFYLNQGTSGGAIYSIGADADLSLTNVEISRNNATGAGGGIYNSGGQLTTIDSNISGNISSVSGGGILNENASATLTRTRIAGNEAGNCGGGIINVGSSVMTLVDSQITGINKANGSGGGICNEAAMRLTEGTVVSTNESEAGGGGIFNSGNLTIRNSLVQNNDAKDNNASNDGLGGGLYATKDSSNTIMQSAIVNNDAATSGGGVLTDGNLEVYNSTISNNSGTFTGGLVVMANGNAKLLNVTMADNQTQEAAVAGSDLHVFLGGTATFGNSIIADTTQNYYTCTNAGGTITSLGYNLSDDATCFNEATDIINADPLLDPLVDGVRMPQVGSPVVDNGNMVMCSGAAVASTDQVGQSRPLFNGCDIGAVEWPGLSVYLPTVIR